MKQFQKLRQTIFEALQPWQGMFLDDGLLALSRRIPIVRSCFAGHGSGPDACELEQVAKHERHRSSITSD